MTDLLISLIKIKNRDFPVYQTVDRYRYVRPVRQFKTRQDALRSKLITAVWLTDEEMSRAWFTRANSLPMPIGIGMGTIPDLAAANT